MARTRIALALTLLLVGCGADGAVDRQASDNPEASPAAQTAVAPTEAAPTGSGAPAQPGGCAGVRPLRWARGQ